MDMVPEEVVLQGREPDGVPTFLGAILLSTVVVTFLWGWHLGTGPAGWRPLGTILGFVLSSMLTHALCGIPFVGILFWMLQWKYRRISDETVRSFFVPGLLYGLVASPLFLSNYFFSLVTPADDLVLLRIPVIFAVSGVSAGAWIAWRFMAARGIRFRFSLTTMLIAVVAAASVLGLFSLHLRSETVKQKYFSLGL